MPGRRSPLLPSIVLGVLACTAPDPHGAVPPPGREDSPGGERHTGLPDSAPPDDSSAVPDSGVEAPPLVVVILADDLGDDLLWAMPTVQERLVPASVRFTRAYTTAPLCCPSRASLLSGGFYPSATGVLANEGTNGGILLFRDTDTLATRLQAAGFTTGLVGKYLNGYEAVAPYVPPGWDLFLAQAWLGDSTNSLLIRGSSTPDAPGTGTPTDTGGAHLTGWLFDEALAFLDAHPDEPTFLLIAPQSPHAFGSAAAEDYGSWEGERLRPASFAEADVSDKPLWIQGRTPDDAEIAAWDATTRRVMENLASLDRGVGTLLDGLESRGLLDRATVVFTSDNGVLRGEHRLLDKGLPYEEAVRVPFLVRSGALVPREDERLVAMNLDLPATVSALAGLPPTGAGVDLHPALVDPTLALREHVYLETTVGDHPAWSGVVTDRWKYVVWATGETELYDLHADPSELSSLHAAPPGDLDLAPLTAAIDPDRALAITTLALALGTVGVPYETALEAWGGTPPLTWRLEDGRLPAGVTFSTDGRFTGIPSEPGAFILGIRVTDSARSPVTNTPATFATAMRLDVGSAMRASYSREEGELAFDLPARPGARVHVRLFLDDTRDTPPSESAVVRAGADGWAHPRIAADPRRIWHWDVVVDGRAEPGGVIRPTLD